MQTQLWLGMNVASEVVKRTGLIWPCISHCVLSLSVIRNLRISQVDTNVRASSAIDSTAESRAATAIVSSGEVVIPTNWSRNRFTASRKSLARA